MANSDIPTLDEIKALRPQEYKVLENKLRRAAARQGLRLEKSRSRDPLAIGYGTYQLVDASTDAPAFFRSGRGYGMDLHDIARYLTGDRTSPSEQRPTTEDSPSSAHGRSEEQADALSVIHQASAGTADDVDDLRRRLFDRRQ